MRERNANSVISLPRSERQWLRSGAWLVVKGRESKFGDVMTSGEKAVDEVVTFATVKRGTRIFEFRELSGGWMLMSKLVQRLAAVEHGDGPSRVTDSARVSCRGRASVGRYGRGQSDVGQTKWPNLATES